MSFFRHQITKAVAEASKSPGSDWDPIDGPETIAEPDEAPVEKPKAKAKP